MLELSLVTRRFGRIVAVEGLDLRLERGEVLGLLGPNGAGKTTTVSMISGLIAPDSGSIAIEGAGSPALPGARRLIGSAPQMLALYDELTAQENLQFFGRLQGLRGRPLRSRVASCLDLVGLADRGRERVAAYSGGMKRRLNLAVALVHDPPCLLLDEPTAGVDPQSRHVLLERIRALRDEGRSVLYTTHYMEEAQRVCDRVAILDHGRLLAVGTVPELLNAHAGRDVLTIVHTDGREERLETDDPLRELERLRSNGCLARFQLERPSLEQVFLGLTGRQPRD